MTSEDEVARLRPWLHHTSACANRGYGDTCTCGLDAALSGVPEGAARPIRHVVVNKAGQCACGARWSEDHAAQFVPSPEPLQAETMQSHAARYGIPLPDGLRLCSDMPTGKAPRPVPEDET